MQTRYPYAFEHVLVIVALLLTITGFWEIYIGAKAASNAYHHLHLVTDAIWLSLVLWQLRLLGTRQTTQHRTVGLLILIAAPLLVASTSLLSVNSAHKGVESGEGDFLIIQNVGVTLEIALLVVLAFVFRTQRKVHGALIMGTVILMIGIATFFTLLSFVPMYKVTGPDTVYRFQTAAISAQVVSIVLALVSFFRDRKNGWPYLLVATFFPINEGTRALLASKKLLDPLTAFVGGIHQPMAFVGTFAVLIAALIATGVWRDRTRAA